VVQNNLYLDQIFLQRLSPKLERFTKKSSTLSNFRCPVCGDSKTSKRKARCYAYTSKHVLMVKCHNCGLIKPFHLFLKDIDGNLYKEYLYEKYKETHKKAPKINPIIKKPVFTKRIKLDDVAERIDSLSSLHFARNYLENRKIPRLDLFYYHSNFRELVFKISPKEETLDSLPKDRRIIIPFYDETNKLFAIQGRALESELRYITIKLDKDTPKIYGLERLDKTQQIYITEGPIDSLFLPNCIAAAGSDLPKNIDGLYIFDNQPRNKEILDKMEKIINMKKEIFIWPNKITSKDINEFVMSTNYSQEDLLSLIKKNTFQGLFAKKEFGNWKKI